jgi:hypothetical protein
MSGNVVWSQASRVATAVSGTKLDSFFRRIHFWRHNAISPRNFRNNKIIDEKSNQIVLSRPSLLL